MDRRKFLQMSGAGLAALTTGFPNRAEANNRVPGISVGYHNPGGGEAYLSSSLYLEPFTDMLRVGTRFVTGTDGKVNLEVASDDYLLENWMTHYGPDRLLFVVNDRDDRSRPNLARMTTAIENTLEVWPSARFLQIGNEPSNFDGMNPAQYANLLGEARSVVRSINPDALVVSAAWFGQHNGVPETHRLWDIMDRRGGIERYCDILAVHDYVEGNNVEIHTAKRRSLGWNNVPIWPTEANTNRGHAQHGNWLRNSAWRIWDDLHDRYDQNPDLPPQTIFIYQGNSVRDVSAERPYGEPDRHCVLNHFGIASFNFTDQGFGDQYVSGQTQEWFRQRTQGDRNTEPETRPRSVTRRIRMGRG